MKTPDSEKRVALMKKFSQEHESIVKSFGAVQKSCALFAKKLHDDGVPADMIGIIIAEDILPALPFAFSIELLRAQIPHEVVDIIAAHVK